jgi:site-specific recombinase XerC
MSCPIAPCRLVSRRSDDRHSRRTGLAGKRHWHPHQLQHTKATEFRRQYGLDAVRAVLGHHSLKITEVFAEFDVNKAAEVMERLG